MYYLVENTAVALDGVMMRRKFQGMHTQVPEAPLTMIHSHSHVDGLLWSRIRSVRKFVA